MGPVSFLTPLGSRSGSLVNRTPRNGFSSGPNRAGLSLATIPFGDYYTLEEFGFSGNSNLPGKLSGSFQRVSSGAPGFNIVQVDGVNGNGIALYGGGGSDTAYITNATARSDFDGWTLTGWYKFLAETVDSSVAFGFLEWSNIVLAQPRWSGDLDFVVSGGAVFLQAQLEAAPTGPFFVPTDSLNLGPIIPGSWIFAAARLHRASGVFDVCLNGSLFGFSTAVPSVNSANPGLNIQISSKNSASGTVLTTAFDELGFWPRYLSDEELDDLYGDGTPPAWPNLPSFPR